MNKQLLSLMLLGTVATSNLLGFEGFTFLGSATDEAKEEWHIVTTNKPVKDKWDKYDVVQYLVTKGIVPNDIFNGANRRARVVTVQDKQCACFILRSYTNDRNIPQREIEGESPTSVWWNKAQLDTRRHWERTRPLVDVRS